jgi:hypothetical protein
VAGTESVRGDLPGGADAELQLLALLAIVDRGCELQPRAEAVLRACATVTHPGPEVAREGGYVAGEYHRLHGWVADADRARPVDALYQHVALLMLQHCMLVHHAVRLAFPKTAHRPARCPIAPELGDPARRLRERRDELARLVDDA